MLEGSDFMSKLNTLWHERFGEDIPTSVRDLNLGTASFIEERLTGFLSRRSQRRFTQEAIEAGLLDLLLASAFSAPSKSDLQQCSVIVVDDPAKRTGMQNWDSFDPWIGKAPIFLVFCGDVRRQRRISERNSLPHKNDNLDTFLNIAVDAAIVLATFVAAAESVGLGCCPISVVRNHLEQARALFALPDGVFPIAGLAVGYVQEASTISLRLPLEITTHRNVYDDKSFEEALDEYDCKRHQRNPIKDTQQRHIQLYGEKANLTWSENAARQMSVPERQGFSEFLRRSGFKLT